MKKFTLAILFFIGVILSHGCTKSEPETFKIVANSWIGYSPLFYAKEKGWLDSIGVKLVNVVSLGESMQLYQVGNAEAFTGTQYEFQQVKERDATVIPVLLFDRSNGGDMVLANKSLAELVATTLPIEVYLEMDSVNRLLFNDFVKANKITDKTFNYKNKDQAEISTLASDSDSPPTIVVTYTPYDNVLKKNGFTELANTRDSLNILVLDALYTTQEKFSKNKMRFKKLKALIDKSIMALQNDPTEYYNQVKPYLDNLSEDEFREASNAIVWLNDNIPQSVELKINNSGFPISDLL